MSPAETAPEAGRILVCDDEEAIRNALSLSLTKAGHQVAAVADATAALRHLDEHGADLLITDITMPGITGLELLRETKTRWPELPVILITGYGSIPTSFAAGRLGADRYVEKPLDIHQIRATVAELLARRLGSDPGDEVLPGLFGRSPVIRAVAEQIRQVAPTHATVLLLGESGTGKDVVARALHELSLGHEKPYLPLNCAAIPGHLLESELFGHERGAFTGAVARQAGKFELAGAGTLFLDEVGELAPDLQAKLLRVLEDRTFMRVGGSAQLRFEARLVAATNRDLQAVVAAGGFREDLYYRLRVVSIEVPPLRERVGDVSLLARRFLSHFASYYSKGSLSFADEVLAVLEQAPWDGNVRELRNVVESLVVLSRAGTIELGHLPPGYREPTPSASPAPDSPAASADARKTMSDIERDAILEALRATGGNRDQAARRLQIGLRTLQRKIKEYRDQGVEI